MDAPRPNDDLMRCIDLDKIGSTYHRSSGRRGGAGKEGRGHIWQGGKAGAGRSRRVPLLESMGEGVVMQPKAATSVRFH